MLPHPPHHGPPASTPYQPVLQLTLLDRGAIPVCAWKGVKMVEMLAKTGLQERIGCTYFCLSCFSNGLAMVQGMVSHPGPLSQGLSNAQLVAEGLKGPHV